MLALLALTLAAAAADAVDDYVSAELSRERIPGLSLAVCRDGRVVKARGYGLANVEHAVPATPDTVYQSGSVGKQFTAAAVMMLVEDGRLGLDDPIARVFPGAPDSWRPITVRHLLTHTSGIKDWGEKEIDYRRDYSEDDLVKVAMGMPLDFAPGTQWSYSNTGYVLLGVLVHKVAGRFYGDVLQERIFRPLGMDATRVISEADVVPHRAAGYRLDKGALKNQEWVSPSLNTTADGSLYLTVLDLARWDAALRGPRLLREASFDAMWTPVRLAGGASFPYGFAWELDEQRGERLIEHGGSWQGFRAQIARYVDRGLTVIVLANLAEAQPDRIAHQVAGLVEPALRLPDPAKPRDDPAPERTARLRETLAAWGGGTPSPLMGAGLRGADAGTERERASRARVARQLETLESFSYLDEDDVAARGLARRGEPVARIVYYALSAGGKTRLYRFYLGGDGRVADFSSEER